jgi:hypothetical protein
VLAAAAVHGGTEPDLLEEVAYWQTDDFWQYAMYAAVAYIRAAASRAGVPVPPSMPGPQRAPPPPGSITSDTRVIISVYLFRKIERLSPVYLALYGRRGALLPGKHAPGAG